jgi:hypothetical protein
VPVRVVAAALALAVAIAVLFAMATIFVTLGRGLSLVDVLTAPIAFVVFAGPPLLVAGTALRATTGAAARAALLLAAVFAVGLEAVSGTPWHFAYWRANARDAQMQMLVATLFAAWPLTLIGMALSRALNSRGE